MEPKLSHLFIFHAVVHGEPRTWQRSSTKYVYLRLLSLTPPPDGKRLGDQGIRDSDGALDLGGFCPCGHRARSSSPLWPRKRRRTLACLLVGAGRWRGRAALGVGTACVGPALPLNWKMAAMPSLSSFRVLILPWRWGFQADPHAVRSFWRKAGANFKLRTLMATPMGGPLSKPCAVSPR